MTVTTSSFDSLNPATGEVIASFPIHTEQDVRAAVERARPAARWWASYGFDGRRQVLKSWRSLLARRIDELADLMHRENGKPIDDAIGEISLAIGHLDWAAGHAPKVLGRHRANPGLLAMNQSAHVEYRPFGVVGVIGPWNYPVHTPMGSISYALAAGNAVVFKPSEYTPGVGSWLARTFAEVAGNEPVFTVVTGLGETGAALCRAGVDKTAFTGSTQTGKQVMAACAETLTPVVIECGGKDAMVVASDADVEAAADAAVWGGMGNAGQTCVGIERVYAAAEIYDALVEKITAKASRLQAGRDFGPITMPGQLQVIQRHIDDALARGARAVVGGADAVRPPYVDPVVLVDVPDDASAIQEETFGPTLTITRVRTDDEAIERANATPFGLGASVFSASRGEQIANRLRCGMVSINSALTFAYVPSVPFGGVGDSGFGRIHGPDGLREFARPQAVTKQWIASPLKVSTFDRPANTYRRLEALVQKVWGR